MLFSDHGQEISKFVAKGPGGVALKIIGYAPASINNVEKGQFFPIRRRRRLYKIGVVFSGHRTLESQEQPSSSTFRVANFARWVPKLFNDSNDFGTILWALFISISTLNSNFFPRIHGRLATRSRRSSRQELKINILGYPQRERESKHGTSYINKRSNQLKCVFAKVTVQLTDKSMYWYA